MSADSSQKWVKARVYRRCNARLDYPFPCRNTIEPGVHYVRSVAFPNHDAHGSDVPWVLAVCDNCAAAYPEQYPPAPTTRPEGEER